MITKITKLEEDIYQIGENDIPVDKVSMQDILSNLSEDTSLLEKLEINNSIEIEHTANKGTVVNIYEVEYPTPENPNNETQEMAKHLDEYNDFVTQNLYPSTEAEDVVVELRHQKEKDVPLHKKESWRKILAWDEKLNKKTPHIFWDVTAYSISTHPNGKQIKHPSRTERINIRDNSIFNGEAFKAFGPCTDAESIKKVYEFFWNDLVEKPLEKVIVTKVVPTGS